MIFFQIFFDKMSEIDLKEDEFELQSKSVFKDYLIKKYPRLCTNKCIISNIECIKLTYEHSLRISIYNLK